MTVAPPFNLRLWIEANRRLLAPPVGNKVLFKDSEFIVMAVAGPNSRKDFHHDPGPELFYQLEGDIVLRIVEHDAIAELKIREGDMFLLPPEVPHSPQRPSDTVGLVVERRRRRDELDGFSWYCEQCGSRLYLERLAVTDLETQLPEVLGRFFADDKLRTCSRCGTVMAAPA